MVSIPRKIHQTWKHKSLPWPLSSCVQSFRIWNPDWEYRLWTDDECDEFISQSIPEMSDFYFGLPKGVLRADIFRLCILYVEGGVYADLDVECLRPLDDLISNHSTESSEILISRDHPCHERIHYNGRPMWLNAFLAASPGGIFLRKVISKLSITDPVSVDTNDPVTHTGPGLLSAIVEAHDSNLEKLRIKEIPWQLATPLPQVFVRFPERNAYKRLINGRLWQEGGQVRLRDDMAVEFCPQGERPYVAHYWWHSYIKSHRQVNMLSLYGDRLLQTDGEIIERKLEKIEYEGWPISIKEALCEFSERHGKNIFVSARLFARLPLTSLSKLGEGFDWKISDEKNQFRNRGGVDLAIFDSMGDLEINLEGIFPMLSTKGLVAVFEANSAEKTKIPNLREAQNYTFLYERQPSESNEIPKLVHRFVLKEGRLWRSAVYDSFAEVMPEWKISTWTPLSLEDFIQRNFPDFMPTFKHYPNDVYRLLASRYLVVAKFGGISVPGSAVANHPLAPLLSWEKMIVEAIFKNGSLATVDSSFFGSVANHCIWNGLENSLEIQRFKPMAEAVGDEFLGNLVKNGPHFLRRNDWPTILKKGTFSQQPHSQDWKLLVKARMWQALRIMYKSHLLQ